MTTLGLTGLGMAAFVMLADKFGVAPSPSGVRRWRRALATACAASVGLGAAGLALAPVSTGLATAALLGGCVAALGGESLALWAVTRR